MPQFTIDQALQTALQKHQAGDLAQAEQLYLDVLAQDPNQADALRLLGVLNGQMGRHELALDLLGRAIAVDPNRPEAYLNLGNALRENRQLNEAIAAYERSIALQNNYPEAYNNLAVALKEAGRLEQSMAACRQAIVLRPDYADAYLNLANALKEAGRLDEAIAACRSAISLRPAYGEAHSNLCNALTANGQIAEAISAGRAAVSLKANHAEAYNNLGNALTAGGRLDEAIPTYRQAVILRPAFAQVHSNLGNALTKLGKLAEAVGECQAATSLDPTLPQGFNNLGEALLAKGDPDQAIAAYREAVALKPNYAEAHANLGNALSLAGFFDEAIAACRTAMSLRKNYAEAHSTLLGILHYHRGYDAAAIFLEHKAWNQQHAEPLKQLAKPHKNERNPDRRLRIGYVSSDLRDHPVGRFMLPLLAKHDKSKFEIFAYTQVIVPHAITQRLRSYTDGWRNIIGFSDAQVADLIREDRIDILIDLAGHTGFNRLLVFARKPAPVQVTYVGYPETTGLTAIDYRITDAHADPRGQTEQFHSEKLVRVPCAWCYDTAGEETAVNESPAIRNGHVTFGCLNNFPKTNDGSLAIYSKVLRQTPGARLLLRVPQGSARNRIGEIFQRENINPDRVEFVGHVPPGEYLELFNRIDVCLDSFPYHGTATTCDSLWMGVPVVSLAGQTHVSRVGVSLLTNLGLPGLVANTEDEFVRLASGLATKPAQLAELCAALRQKMQRSPLMDGPAFARNMEATYRRMWQRYCATTK